MDVVQIIILFSLEMWVEWFQTTLYTKVLDVIFPRTENRFPFPFTGFPGSFCT